MAEYDPQLLPVDQTRSLLRLYLSWPEKIEDDPGAEAEAFYMWLSNELSEDELSELAGSSEDVDHFVTIHNKVLSRARYLKGWHASHSVESREDPRTAVHTQVFFVIYDCTADPSLEGRIMRGIVLDTAPAGMRIEAHDEVPPGAILAITVVATGQQMSAYHLTGEVRWHAEHSESHHIGISLFNIEGHERWREFHTLNSIRS